MSQILRNEQTQPAPQASGMSGMLAPIVTQLQAVEALLAEQANVDEEILRQRLAQSGLSGGKKMRPGMLLLAGACFGDLKKTHIAAAAAIELVHVASLVHDDVLDEADERRHEKSINARWDNMTSILTGDYLFSKAFEVGCQSGSLEVMRRIAVASCNVCQGEMMQNALAGDYTIDESRYYEIISLKTAELCSCACGLGAILSECDETSVERFEQFGIDLGIAFQIIDDVLDIVGEKDQVGKTLGTDLKNQKATLPIIHCLGQLSSDESGRWIAKLNSGNWKLGEVLELLDSNGSIEYSRQTARQHAGNALDFARSLSDSTYSRSLVQLAEFVLQRTS